MKTADIPMQRPLMLSLILSLGIATLATAEPTVQPTDWPWWRGPARNGIASPDQSPPLRWSETENVLWKTAVPGRGHGSPTVVGDQVFLATAELEQETQSVLCFDRQTGELLWTTLVHRGNLNSGGNAKATLASSTVACDGQRLFINFFNDGAIYTTALSRSGKQLWQTKVSDYVIHQGFGSSPGVYKDLVLVSADNKGGGAIAALDSQTGKIVWKHDRPKTPNYASPIVLPVAGRDQLLFTGCNLVSSFDPQSGEQLWQIDGATTECVTSTVTDGKLIFTSGGYPKNHMAAVAADGSGKVVWENNTRVYVPSMLVHDGYLYAMGDSGIAMCFEAATGESIWRERIGGTFTASPVMQGNRIYVTAETGATTVLEAGPKGGAVLAKNQLGDQAFATMVIAGGKIFTRVAHNEDGKRQEYLYCLGE